MTWPYLRASSPNSAKFCFSVLKSIQHEVGFIPSLSLNMETFSGLSEPGRTHYVLLEAYHTVYVGGLLASACLSQPHLPDKALDRHDFSSDPAPLRLQLRKRPVVPRWEVQFEQLGRAEQGLLTPFVATVALSSIDCSRGSTRSQQNP